MGRRAVRYLTLSLPGWLAYDPRGGGVAVGGTGDRVEGGCPTTTGVSSELRRGLAAVTIQQ